MPEQKDIFRKSSLQRISSPEKLNEYIRVSKPSVWIILGAVIVLFIAAGIWGFSAEITADGLRPIDFLLGR